MTGGLEDIHFSEVFKKQSKSCFRLCGQSCHGNRFLTGGLDDIQFSKVFKKKGKSCFRLFWDRAAMATDS